MQLRWPGRKVVDIKVGVGLSLLLVEPSPPLLQTHPPSIQVSF